VACICAFQKARSGVFPPNKSAGSECPMCFTSQVHKAFLRAIFRPSRAPAQCSCQAAGASRSQHRLSSFLLHMANYGSRRRMVRLNAVYPSVIVSPALCISTSRGRSKSRLCSGSDSHVSEFVGGFHAHPEPTSSLLQVHGLPTLTDGMP